MAVLEAKVATSQHIGQAWQQSGQLTGSIAAHRKLDPDRELAVVFCRYAEEDMGSAQLT